MGKVTPDERLARMACFWRRADKAVDEVKHSPDVTVRLRAGARLHKAKNRLRDATDAYMKASTKSD